MLKGRQPMELCFVRMWLSGEIILDSEAFLTSSEVYLKLALKIHLGGLKSTFKEKWDWQVI